MLDDKLDILVDMCEFGDAIRDVLDSILRFINKFTAPSQLKQEELVKIMEFWNNDIDTKNGYFEDALEALKAAKTKVSRQHNRKFNNLSKYTKDIINYFQDDLQSKLNVKIGDTKIILKKIEID